jgi:hypothetical protein
MDLRDIRVRNYNRYWNMYSNKKHVKSLLNRTINKLHVHITNGNSIESFFDEFEIENRLYWVLWALYRLCKCEEMNNVKTRYYFDKRTSSRLQFIELLKTSLDKVYEAYRRYDSYCNVPHKFYENIDSEFCNCMERWNDHANRISYNDFFVHACLDAVYAGAYNDISTDIVERIETYMYIYQAFINSSYFKLQGRHEINIITTDLTEEIVFEKSEDVFLTIDTALL